MWRTIIQNEQISMNEKETKETTTTTSTGNTPVTTPSVTTSSPVITTPEVVVETVSAVAVETPVVKEAVVAEVVETPIVMQTVTSESIEPPVVVETTTPTGAVATELATVEAASSDKSPRIKWVVAAIVVVGLVVLGILYQLEKEGRSSTTLFTTLIAKQEASRVVATVNGEAITGAELKTSVEQFSQMAVAQQVDITSPEAAADIKKQALEVLVNTKILKQEAITRGVVITDEEVTTRLDAIKEEIGGEEVLLERMTTLGINTERLQNDIKDELTIKKLLDEVFAESDMKVSDEEIATVYEGAGGEEAGFGTLAEVREQIIAQLTASKEQAAIDELLTKLKEGAKVEIKE